MLKGILIFVGLIVLVMGSVISLFLYRVSIWEEIAITEKINTISIITHELGHVEDVVIKVQENNKIWKKGDHRKVIIELQGENKIAYLIGNIIRTQKESEFEFNGTFEANKTRQTIKFLYSGISTYRGSTDSNNDKEEIDDNTVKQ